MNKSIKITSEKHNRLVQLELFRLGFEWCDGDTEVFDMAMTGHFINIGIRSFYWKEISTHEMIHLKDLKEM